MRNSDPTGLGGVLELVVATFYGDQLPALLLQLFDQVFAIHGHHYTYPYTPDNTYHEGRRQEAIAMLTRFLTKRFGPIDEATREQLQKAEVEQIEAWSDRAFDVQSIEEVFESA